MNELEFKLLCKQNNADNKFIITKNNFSNKPNIIGCNNSNNNYIIYSTNRLEICTLQDEVYAFKFLYLMLNNYLDLQINYSKEKVKKFKKI